MPVLEVNGAPETCPYKLWLANERHYVSISLFFFLFKCNNIGYQGFHHETFIFKTTQMIYKGEEILCNMRHEKTIRIDIK